MSTPHQCKFVVDCEFSTVTNELISMAIVPLWTTGQQPYYKIEAEPDREFYEVISPLPQNLSEWVQVNVVPHLNKPGVTMQQFQEKLEAFFIEHQIEELHYDWCADIAYVNNAMMTGPGQRIKLGGRYLSHIHHPSIPDSPHSSHNALEDARALAATIRERFITQSL